MSRYMLDKALWRYARENDFRSRWQSDPASVLGDFDLTQEERSALESGGLRNIFQLGAHPFLIYSFAIARNGGWSFELMERYVAELDGLTLGDIET